jgi:hypothetical protein
LTPRLVILLILSFLLTSCGTLAVYIEQTPTPDYPALETLSAMMYQGTQQAAIATQMNLAPTPTSSVGQASGRICYTGIRIPPMIVYFKNLAAETLVEMPINDNQSSYTQALAPGKYVAYGWVPSYQIGGLYSQAVPCGLKAGCGDHRPVEFEIIPGETTENIDICDWGIPPDQLPVPPGSQLPLP